MPEWLAKHYTWLFSGAGLAALGLGCRLLMRWFAPTKERSPQPLQAAQTQINNQNTNVNVDVSLGHRPEQPETRRKEHQTKSLTNILFIDDDTSFKVIKIFKQSGWPNVKILKDVVDLSHFDVANSDILFIDIHGVGKLLGFRDEGLGLAIALKEKFPDKKLVIYSSDRSGDRFHDALRIADDTLPKDAEPYEFIRVATNLAEEIHGNS